MPVGSLEWFGAPELAGSAMRGTWGGQRSSDRYSRHGLEKLRVIDGTMWNLGHVGDRVTRLFEVRTCTQRRRRLRNVKAAVFFSHLRGVARR